MPKSPYRIIHLSDLHLTPGGKVDRTEVSLPGTRLQGMNLTFRKILQSKEVQSADAVLITGDVTDAGDRASWRVFLNNVQRQIPNHKTIVVAGNHDVCKMAWGVSFKDIFEKFTQSNRRTNLNRLASNLALIKQPTEYPWSVILDDEHRRVLVVALDSNYSGNFSLADNAVGEIGQLQLDELDFILKKHSEPENSRDYVPVRIVAMHHSPNLPRYETLVKRGILPKKNAVEKLWAKFNGQVIRWTHQIPKEERRRLREVCLKYHVRLIAHGHMHDEMNRRVNGPSTRCIASTYFFEISGDTV